MTENVEQKPLILKPGEGRLYPMGRMEAVFKADLTETSSALSVSEWCLQPESEGPPIHKHAESHVFYVIEGCLAVYLDDIGWTMAAKGSYIYIPGETEHSFENRSTEVVRFISFNAPGGFEQNLPSIVSYFEQNPLGASKSSTR